MSKSDGPVIPFFSYICASCGAIERLPFGDILLDTGTTFKCSQCGGDTVIQLLSVPAYVEQHQKPRRTEEDRKVRNLCRHLREQRGIAHHAMGILERVLWALNLLRDDPQVVKIRDEVEAFIVRNGKKTPRQFLKDVDDIKNTTFGKNNF